MKKAILVSIFLCLYFTGRSQSGSIDFKVDSILNLMTLEEKIGQMTQVERGSLNNINDLKTYSIGSILSGGGSSPSPNTVSSWANMYDQFQNVALQSRLGIPIIYGIDAVHGHNNVKGAVIFPHNIGMGCTWNPELVYEAGKIVAKEVAATGIDWTFAPCIAVARNERWGRTYEGFGETPEIQKIMSWESVGGLQGENLSHPATILACAKHYVGDGGTQDGKDQGNTVLSEAELRAIHLPGYFDAIEAGVGSIMASYNSWNGEKLHGQGYLLSYVLKNEMNFEGFVISDWKGVDQIDENFRVAIKRGINAGIDMVMVPDRYVVFINHLISLVEDGEVSEQRINGAVRRILKQKFLLDLFEHPYTDSSLQVDFGSEEHRNVARQSVRESMVLLNASNDILPLNKNGQKILVAGNLANDLGAQCGGWTISWQGGKGNITTGTSILKGIQNISETSEIIYSANGEHDGSEDIAIVVIGEKEPYAEGVGDRSDLNLDIEDLQLVKKLKEDGIPVIAILVSGRPLILGQLLTYTDAFIAAWYPGTEGEGIAEVLFGDYLPKGKLTHSWPAYMNQIPINIGDENYDPLYEYKHGLQFFPNKEMNGKLNPYAAKTDTEGESINLKLTGNVTQLDFEDNDFELVVNETIITGAIKSISLEDFDQSILRIELNEAFSNNDQIRINYSGNGIISESLILEAFNGFFVYNSIGSAGGSNKVPGRVEAENFIEMSGIQTETCSDIGGGINVGYIEPGDWMKYNIEVTQTGLYQIVNRISGYSNGSYDLVFNNDKTAQVNFNSTNGWQNWKDFSTEIQLEAGNYEMKFTAENDAFNINYFDFDLISSNDELSRISAVEIFPNPSNELINITFSNQFASKIKIQLLNESGKYCSKLFEGQMNSGKQTFSFPIDPEIAKGLYFIEIWNGRKRHFEKLVIN